MTRAPVIIYGAGGHGTVVLDALERSEREVRGFVDDAPERIGRRRLGYPVHAALDAADAAEVEVVVAIGAARARADVMKRVQGAGYTLATVVHPSAVVGARVELGPGAMILAGAVVNSGARVGAGAIVNTGAVIDHDCVLGDCAHVAPGASLAGNVTVGDEALVGVGASVVPGVRIGADAVVGAGAAVIGDVPAGVTVAGVPARPLRAAANASGGSP